PAARRGGRPAGHPLLFGTAPPPEGPGKVRAGPPAPPAGRAAFPPAPAVPSEIYFPINGVPRPRLTIRPGETQRWRIVNGAAHRALELAIERKGSGVRLPMQQIAQDGINFAVSKERQTI